MKTVLDTGCYYVRQDELLNVGTRKSGSLAPVP